MAFTATQAQAIGALCRSSFSDFVKTFWHVVVPEPCHWNWHMDVICDSMQAWAERIFRREPKQYDEVCNVPPGTSKSTIASVMFPGWAWTRAPWFATIGASYNEDLAHRLAMKCRDVIKSPLYTACFPEIVIRPDLDTKGEFGNTRGGVRMAVGSGGGVQGAHADAIVIDDPINPRMALSSADLYAINNWIETTLGGRKKDKRVTVTFLIMQRLHQDDPTARMLSRRNVRHICLPDTTDFPIKPIELADRYVDGLLDPVRMPWSVVADNKELFKEYGYAGQFGQQPVPLGGGMFKIDNLRWGPVPSVFRSVIRFWDRASTMSGTRAAKRSAYTVGVKMGLDTNGRYWVLDVIRRQLDSFRREALITRTAHSDRRGCWVGQEREPGSGGHDQVLRTLRRLSGFVVKTIPSVRDKEKRADGFSEQVNGGNVWLPSHMRTATGWAGWAKDYVDEMKHFPFSTTKDQIDASSGAFTALFTGRRRSGPLRTGRRVRG